MATSGKRFPPNKTKTMANIMVSSQTPIPNMINSTTVVNDVDVLTSLSLIKNQGAKALSISQAQALGEKLLADIGIDTSKLDMRLLLAQVLGYSGLKIFLEREQLLLPDQWDDLSKLLKRRLCFEPMAYISGVKEFYGHELSVSPSCLIPRPDTECVVELCLKILSDIKEPQVFDIATGSGAISIALLKERSDMCVIASDLSHEALNLAGFNAHKLGVLNRISFVQGDLFKPFARIKPSLLAHMIVSNPPYISTGAYETLASEVKNYEPAMALLAGDEQGLNFYRRLLDEAHEYLLPNGFLVLEVGFDQSEIIAQMALDFWENIAIHNDLANRPRVVVMQKKEGFKNGNVNSRRWA